ncbi:sigma-70 family RNA polymerase sigma factor [Comamonas testosteroni]|uniref:sigma-70 family RNA polymerase sigma factor n=1 Tax=Comamonas testosteroni TaxID=285 RepID=UPI0006A5C0B1|nr:sigma-70 family RNA polymerase sigma factor [Comamonas testosteroni]
MPRHRGLPSVTASSSAPADPVHALYVEHHGWLQHWLRRKLGNAFEASDIAHDTFVNVIVSGMAARIEQPRPFLVTVAKNLVIRHYRRRVLEQAYLDAVALLTEDLVPPPEERLIVLESLQAVDQVLDALAPKAREAFLLAHLEGLTYAAIAQRLGVSMTSVKRYLMQAHRQCFLLALA